MKRTETNEVGTIYTLYANEAGVQIPDLGREVQLRSRNDVMGRRWFVQGVTGVVKFHAPAGETQEACERFLAANGYVAGGTLPPECFEYRKA